MTETNTKTSNDNNNEQILIIESLFHSKFDLTENWINALCVSQKRVSVFQHQFEMYRIRIASNTITLHTLKQRGERRLDN